MIAPLYSLMSRLRLSPRTPPARDLLHAIPQACRFVRESRPSHGAARRCPGGDSTGADNQGWPIWLEELLAIRAPRLALGSVFAARLQIPGRGATGGWRLGFWREPPAQCRAQVYDFTDDHSSYNRRGGKSSENGHEKVTIYACVFPRFGAWSEARRMEAETRALRPRPLTWIRRSLMEHHQQRIPAESASERPAPRPPAFDIYGSPPPCKSEAEATVDRLRTYIRPLDGRTSPPGPRWVSHAPSLSR